MVVVVGDLEDVRCVTRSVRGWSIYGNFRRLLQHPKLAGVDMRGIVVLEILEEVMFFSSMSGILKITIMALG